MKGLWELLRFLFALPFIVIAVFCFAIAFRIDADSTVRIYISPLQKILEFIEKEASE